MYHQVIHQFSDTFNVTDTLLSVNIYRTLTANASREKSPYDAHNPFFL